MERTLSLRLSKKGKKEEVYQKRTLSLLLVSAFCAACIFALLIDLAQARIQFQAATNPAEDFVSTIIKSNPSSKKEWTGLIVGLVVGVGVGVGGLSLLSVFVVFCILRRRKSQSKELLEMGRKKFSYAELQTATDDFNSDNKLGEGGFGAVYKGKLNDGREIAVKLQVVTLEQGEDQFFTEIDNLSAVQHRNLVKFYGYCIEGDKRLLVYEYLENKSLHQALFGRNCLDLPWSNRYKICLGVAKGLKYLHEDSPIRIIHRDVKPSNILLDSNHLPKISDFGLAKPYDDEKTHIITNPDGTIGYRAPEYAMRGYLTEKNDVFAFGVMVLETISRRRFFDRSLGEEQADLLHWAWQLYREKNEAKLVDSTLSEFRLEEVKRLIGVSLWCTQQSPERRPVMERVVAMLIGDVEVSTVTSRPGYSSELGNDTL